MRKLYVWACIAMSCILVPVCAGQEEEVDYFDLSLEELLSMKISTAGKKLQSIQDIPASVVVITRADIEQYGWQSLNDILEHVPGLYGIEQRSVDGMKFGVRGFWSSTAPAIQYLINGVRQERVGADGSVYLANRVPPEAIDRIEIIRGPMSVLYGSGAFFGVINIITNDESQGGQALAGAGNMGATKAFVRKTYHNDDLKLVFNAGYNRTDGPDEPYSRMSTLDLADAFGVRVDSTKDRWSERYTFFNFSARLEDFYADVNYELAKKGADVFFPASLDGAVAKRTYQSIALGYLHDFSDHWNLDVKLTYHKGSVQTDWDWFIPEGELNLGGDINYREDFELDVTQQIRAGDKLDLTVGLYYKKIIHEQLWTVAPLVDFIYRLGITDPAINKAAFIQADYRASEKLSFVLGARADQADKYGTYYRIFAPGEVTHRGEYKHDDVEFLPRVAAIYKQKETNVFKFLYGQAINHPIIYQNGTQAYLGQQSLDPEFITTLELNHIWAPSPKLTTNFSLFYNKLDKLIINEISTIDGGFLGNNRNSGEIRTEGAELTIHAAPGERVNLELSAMYQKSDDRSPTYNAFDVPYSPSVLGYARGTYKVNQNTSWSVAARYVDKMETLYDVTTGGRIAPATDSYVNLDTNIRVNKLFGSGYFLQLSGKNITDKDYLFPAFTLNISWADLGIVGNGRSYQLTIGKKFDK